MKYTVKPRNKKSVYSATDRVSRSNRSRVFAAADDDDEDLFGPGMDDIEDDADFNDTLDDVADTVEDIQDAIDEVDEDDIDIDVDNNISNHYIAECDGCHGVFISAMIESDQEVEKISGVCPLCTKQTDQYLKWVVKDVEESSEE